MSLTKHLIGGMTRPGKAAVGRRVLAGDLALLAAQAPMLGGAAVDPRGEEYLDETNK